MGLTRKGMELGTALIIMVIFGAVFIVVLLIMKQLLAIGNSQFTEKQCQTSLLLTKATSALTPWCALGTPTPFSLQCSRDFITVSDTSVVKNGRDMTKSYDASCPAPNAQPLPALPMDAWAAQTSAKAPVKQPPSDVNVCLAKNAVADEMASCWSTFFQGEMPVLQQTDIASINIFSAKDYKRSCFICGEITVKAKKGLDNVDTYLQTKAYKGDLSYYQYLANDSKAWCDPKLQKGAGTCYDAIRLGKRDFGALTTTTTGVATVAGLVNPGVWLIPIGQLYSIYNDKHAAISVQSLTTDQKYAVVFVRRGLGTCDAKNTDKTGDLTNTVQLVPADMVGQVCDVVVS